MQTHFSLAQLANANIAEANSILRNCVHCGFCTATCPTYVILGSELDSPRGRIYMIKDYLENDRPADKHFATHIDRCLSCLSCMSTCPSGVNYMHLVDHARVHLETTYRRPFMDRTLRYVLAMVMPYPARFRAALRLASLGRPFAGIFEKFSPLKPVAAMLRLAPAKIWSDTPHTLPGVFSPSNSVVKKGRIALLNNCVQPVLDAEVNSATISLLNRLGVEVVLPKGEACCGSLAHHMGREKQALEQVRHMVDIWHEEIETAGLDAILVTASGCGTTIKDYGFMLRNDKTYAEKAAKISALALDITEYLGQLDLPAISAPMSGSVAYHSACSLQHGQQIKSGPKELLRKAGLTVHEPAEPHLCCGSAGTYNIMHVETATLLRDRKIKNIDKTGAEIIVAGNVGCITHLAMGTDRPVLHIVKLLNWAYGGGKPSELDNQ